MSPTPCCTPIWRRANVIDPATYAGAALVVLASGVVSAWLVRRPIDRLDLVAVLTVRE
ncbi:hypothetical protein [Tepidimonas sp.]|uniref:hypothetical protein n=1 Tax=Tepidimonas sp. TaxID=2002775 RepID=UPI0039188A20